MRTEMAMAPGPHFCFNFSELQWFRMAAAEGRVASTRARSLSVGLFSDSACGQLLVIFLVMV